MISFLEVCAFPPIRQRKANGWGTELIQIHTVRELEANLAKKKARICHALQAYVRSEPLALGSWIALIELSSGVRVEMG